MTRQQQQMLSPRTATPDQSIWQDIPETSFREHLVTLEKRTNAVPVPSQTFPFPPRTRCSSAEARLLSIGTEQRLADDFAYIAAVGEGAQSVSAACVEEHITPPSLCIRFAAIDTVSKQVQHAFNGIGSLLERAVLAEQDDEVEDVAHALLKLIVEQQLQKLFGRLRSNKWQKPKYLSCTHKKSLWLDLETVIHRLQFIYTKRKDPRRLECETPLRKLAAVYRRFEDIPYSSSNEFEHILHIVTASYELCQNTTLKDFAARLDAVQNPTSQVAAAIKTLRQVEKIGSYQRIVQDLVTCARKYPMLFENLRFEFLPIYAGVATDIGFESWAKTVHVHAEVQLAVYYDMLSMGESERFHNDFGSFHKPRVIGTSKYLCYLCYLFLKYHGEFIPINTHGKLYDQWTIPDLAEFNDSIREKYRKTIEDIDADVVLMSNQIGPREGKRDSWRFEPMTSRQNLLNPVDSEPTELIHQLDADSNDHASNEPDGEHVQLLPS